MGLQVMVRYAWQVSMSKPQDLIWYKEITMPHYDFVIGSQEPVDMSTVC